MKKLCKLLIITILPHILLTSCDLEENPPFLSEASVYSTVDGVDAALNGVYSSLIDYSYYGHDYHTATNYMSGMFMGGRPFDFPTIISLNTLPNQNYTSFFWLRAYQNIGRANDLIANVSEDTGDEEIDNMLGVTYFLRAQSYLHLVRLYGGVPLRTRPATKETIHLARASAEEVYDLIISDLEKAKGLMKEANQQKVGRSGKYAANMLLAKTYMTLAGNDNSSPYWQKAYDEAIQVYGKYSLVSNYNDLWDSESTANHNSESIFEINFNAENFSRFGRMFTVGNAYAGPGWRRFRAFPEVVDAHMDRYPGDPRFDATFRSEYERYRIVNLGLPPIRVYPSSARTNPNNSFTYINKYFIKDQTRNNDATNFNYVHLRYADLLLMLAEIENELNGPANAYQYVNEVLTRARNSSNGAVEPANWSGLSQDEFRDAIMKEYHYELYAEGHDFFVGHRRGYQFFKTNYIDVHNARNEKPYDLVLSEGEKVMLAPIPTLEIETNNEINQGDQNPGY